jgi:hypothetical protein
LDRAGKARHFLDDGHDSVIDLIRFHEGIAEPTGLTILIVIAVQAQIECPVLHRHQWFVQIILLTPLTGGEQRYIESQRHNTLSWKPTS